MKNILLILHLSLQTTLVAQRTISMSFDLSQNAANNIIVMEGNFPLIYSGYIGGESYYFELEQPTIEFNSNNIKMIALLKINTSQTGYMEFNLEPSVQVNYSLSTDNVIALLQNFTAYINNQCSQIPQNVRDKIIEHYNALQLELYPVKIIEYAENYIPDFLDIDISFNQISVQSFPGKLNIGISFTATGTAPAFICSTYNRSTAKIKSNVKVEIKRLTLFDLYTTYKDWEGTIEIPKGGEASFDIYNAQNTGNNVNGRYIKILLYSEERGTFLRVYSAANMPYSNQWEQHSQHVSFD